MSFSSEQKQAVIGMTVKNACCRRATLAGILASKGVAHDHDVEIRLSADLFAFVSQLILETYAAEPSPIRSLNGGRGKTLRFASKSAFSLIAGVDAEKISVPAKCPSCKASFLRGVFLAAGRISDPEKAFCLEFSVGNRIRQFSCFFDELGIPARAVERGQEKILYYKSTSSIEDFFAAAQMPQTAFALLNASIASEIRNQVNRVANCETSNIRKAVRASVDTVQKLRRLDALGLFSRIPEDLQGTARLRIEEDSLSLAQLAARTTPPLTKSGIGHRLQKIDSIASDLLKRFDTENYRKD